MYDEIYPTFLEDKTIMEVQQSRIDLDPGRPLLAIRADSALAVARKVMGRKLAAAGQLRAAQAAE
jgi:hypothetical protein